jgi:hypothetical protein
MQQTQPLYCCEGVFTASLHSNGCYSIVACIFIATEMGLPSRFLAKNIYSDFTIPALWCYAIPRSKLLVKFEVLATLTTKNVTLCSLVEYCQRFGGTCFLCLQS